MLGTAALQQALQAGFQYHEGGQFAQAEAVYRQVLAQEPSNAMALYMLGLAQHQTGQHRSAVDLIGQAIHIDPSIPDFYNTLGEAWRALGHFDRAINCYQAALSIDPTFVEAHSNLGVAHHAREETDAAFAAYERAVQLRPDFAPAYYNLGVLFEDAGWLDEAIRFYERATELQPQLFEAHANMAKSLGEQGKLAESIERYRIALQIRPDHAAVHSSLLMNMLFDPHYDSKGIFEEHQRWSAIHADRFTSQIRPHTNHRNPGRRLRIGYMSPDFRNHVVGYLFEPVLAHHDHEQFEVTCYSNVGRPDVWTNRLQTYADHWRDITRMSDDQVAEQVRADGIDILVDLALHLARNRLLVFARKPAPVQVTYLGYAATTGLKTMDYRLTDPQMDPPEYHSPHHTEKHIYLPHCYWCYRPHPESPAVIDPPVLRSGQITFGSTNSFTKVNEKVIAAWSAILGAVPHSRILIVISGGARGNDHVRKAFLRHGIGPERLMLMDRCPLEQYLALYQQIDITLDPFPYNGGTTSLDALWMGTPVVTLAGVRAVSRAGLTLLTNIGLSELVAGNVEQYIRIACDLAGDINRMTMLRRGMRERMRQSPLLDEAGFTRAMEAACRDMWKRWCLNPQPA